MALPSIQIQALPAPGSTNNNNTARLFCASGVCSAGPILQPVTLSSRADLAQFGQGPGVEHAAALGAAGWPVIFCREPTATAGSIGTVRKRPAAVASTTLYGALLVAGGSSPNGDVLYTAKTTGVSLVLLGGTSQTLAIVSVASGVITVQLGTDGGAAVTSTATQIAALVNGNASAAALVTAAAQGNGTGIGAVLAETAIANGDVVYTPRADGVTVRHQQTGSNTTLLVSVSTLAVTVRLATNGDGEPTSTAAAVAAAIAANSAAALLVSATASGAGTGKAGVWGFQALTYGSTAALALSGTPVNAFAVQVECLAGGAVGASPAPAARWSLDGGAHWSARTLVASDGTVTLADGEIDSGMVATFTGTLAERDAWAAETTAPAGDASGVTAALTAALADTGKVFGSFTSSTGLSKAECAALDVLAQAALQTRQVSLLLAARLPGAAEPESDWRTALIADFAGLQSTAGLVRVAAGAYQGQSSYTGKRYRLQAVVQAGLRAAATPIHEDLGFVGRGSLPQIAAAVPGALVVSGADANGGVYYRARRDGVSVSQVKGSGANSILKVAVAETTTAQGTTAVITVTLATDGSSVISSTAADVAAALAKVNLAAWLAQATALGDGTGLAGTTTVPQAISAEVLQHDERLQQGLNDARFITLRTYEQAPGAYYITRSPSMAAANDAGWNLLERSDVGLTAIRAVVQSAFPDLLDSLASIGVAEGPTVPAGALTVDEADRLGRKYSSAVNNALLSPKSDGRASVSPYPQGVQAVSVSRGNNYQAKREVQADVTWVPLGLTEQILFRVRPTVA